MEMACLEAGGEWVEVRRSEQVGKYKAKEPEGLLAVVVRLHSIIRSCRNLHGSGNVKSRC
ncbi:hypothetical protein ACRE_042500 [Hapsidospora chrysogenum ATCC 11550]|uniref:Uncharacterized protein n=1 Tax=Hapsidospora chrysogenum (strain ATCC 11550 / CBS 779.69 / DSM 880 / IAM 14645 / JCM 23072 / IMI 49137) TaxID=857340 RepID=A0A086T6H5_HAPC1|nr:hypothetical protein ACRE_042500 [Hapsidospora chrysogenum ATCC 11550]